MTVPPTRAQILAALQDGAENPLAERVAGAVADYGRAFAGEANRREFIRLPAPNDEVEAVALELFLDEVRASMPSVKIKIKGDS